eukprot:364930-Chlamydomonas_euryale.AAC.5
MGEMSEPMEAVPCEGQFSLLETSCADTAARDRHFCSDHALNTRVHYMGAANRSIVCVFLAIKSAWEMGCAEVSPEGVTACLRVTAPQQLWPGLPSRCVGAGVSRHRRGSAYIYNCAGVIRKQMHISACSSAIIR